MPKPRKRRSSSSADDGLLESPIRPPTPAAGDYPAVYVAYDFKNRKPGESSAGISMYWEDGHYLNASHPLRGDNITQARAQLAG